MKKIQAVTVIYSDGNKAQHFTGSGTVQAIEVELVGSGKMIQLLVRLDMDVQ
jgi:hypothetical protein